MAGLGGTLGAEHSVASHFDAEIGLALATAVLLRSVDAPGTDATSRLDGPDQLRSRSRCDVVVAFLREFSGVRGTDQQPIHLFSLLSF